MILLQSTFENNAYKLNVLPNQKFEKSLTRKLEDIRISAPLAEFAKFSLGAVFIASNYDFPEDDHLFIRKEDVTALYYEGSVLPISHRSGEDLQKICEYTVDYLLDQYFAKGLAPDDTNEEFQTIKKIAEGFTVYGYTMDWEEKTNPKMPDPSEEKPSGSNLKRTIAAHYPVPKYEETGFYIDPDVWFLLVRNALRGENTLLAGPTGSGKTEILSHLALALGKDLHITDMGTVQDAQSALLGVHRLNKEGHSVFEYAPFVGNIKSGGIVLLDELNR